MTDTPDLLPEYAAAFARQLLTAAGGVLVARGVIDEAAVPALVGAGVAFTSLAWSIIQKRNKAKALKAAIAAPAGRAS